jgi:hypothetical protein
LTTHRIHVDGDGPAYTVTGAVQIAATAAPVQAAALALRQQGAHDRDIVATRFGGCTICPAQNGAILRPRKPVSNADLRAAISSGSRF